MNHIEKVETHHTGGGCMVDILTLPNGKIVAVSDEYVGLYDSVDALYESEPIKGFWINGGEE